LIDLNDINDRNYHKRTVDLYEQTEFKHKKITAIRSCHRHKSSDENSQFPGKWTMAFDYHLGTDIDQINNPTAPLFITVQGGPKSIGATEKFNVHFTLDRDYTNGELAFIYDRWGAEKNQVSVNNELLTPIGGAGKGMFKHVALSLKDIPNGDHVITITTSGETETGGHRIDYLKLSEIEKSA
jgi:hypothetical protein